MIKFYLIVIMVVLINGDVKRGPSHLKWRWNPGGIDVRWSMKDYGMIDYGVVAVEADQATHDLIATLDGVFAFPVDLDTSPSPQELSDLEALLESRYIPANWMTPSHTWREILRTVTGMFMFMQRYTAITGSTPIEQGLQLNDKFSGLDPNYQAAMIMAFEDLGHDSSVIKTNWTLRVILKEAADQWGTTPVLFGFITL